MTLADHIKTIRSDVFERDNHSCRVCFAAATSMHELEFASLVGDREKATTLDNCIAVCGSGTTGCHGLLQHHIVNPIANAVDALGIAYSDANDRCLAFRLSRGYDRHMDVIALRCRLERAQQFDDSIDVARHLQIA